jgi:hypothetical protein
MKNQMRKQYKKAMLKQWIPKFHMKQKKNQQMVSLNAIMGVRLI